MDSEILESVLKEILEEPKELKLLLMKLTSCIEDLDVKVNAFNGKLEHQKVLGTAVDLRPIQGVVKTGVEKIRQIVSEQPKEVVRQFRFLLFPERYADSYCRIVFGRLASWMMIVFYCYIFVCVRENRVLKAGICKPKRTGNELI